MSEEIFRYGSEQEYFYILSLQLTSSMIVVYGGLVWLSGIIIEESTPNR